MANACASNARVTGHSVQGSAILGLWANESVSGVQPETSNISGGSIATEGVRGWGLLRGAQNVSQRMLPSAPG